MTLEQRPLGKTGLKVSVIGLGAAQLGNADLTDAQAERLVHTALELGVTLFDTARAYGFSEERLGRHLKGFRHEVVVSTKVGYGIPGHENWTAGCITAGIERALKVMGTEVIDLVHLHSCPLDVLSRGECTEALTRAVRAGKVRVAAYSGDGVPLHYALEAGAFPSVQLSLSLYDQAELARNLPQAHLQGTGVIVKRPLANAPWRFTTRPVEQDLLAYLDRHATMKLNRMGLAWEEFALRFSAFQPGVHSCIVGTANENHLKAAVKAVEYGALPAALNTLVRQSFEKHGKTWPAII
jgi:aryl-alcohol dehydrogenase-like predicted oxidoreductase